MDAWAILAWLRDEQPAASDVGWVLSEADVGAADVAMSVVNAGEVYYRTLDLDGEVAAAEAQRELIRLPMALVPCDDEAAWSAAVMKSTHRLGYADAHAAALARGRDASVVTGDPDFLRLRDEGVLEVTFLTRD